MQRYYFHLRDGARGYTDSVGVDLAHDGAAADHARCVAAELVKNREPLVRHWRIEVYNDEAEPIFSTRLLAVDRTLDHVRPPAKALLEKLMDRREALREAIATAQATLRKSRALVSRSRGRPHLAADRGEAI